MGDLRHQILLARGSTSNVNNKKSSLSYGEPLFDREMNYLYIGQKNSGANNPITSDRVWGKINNIEYSFNADSTGAYIKSNTLQFDVKDTSSNNILSATNSNLIFKGDLKSGHNTIYIYSTDTLTVTDISSRSGGILSNFGINTGNRDIWTGSGTISTSASITTPKISGVNNTLSIDATSGVNFNGKITSNDLLINLRADINQINANELAISKTSGIGISCYDSAIATKEIQAPSTNALNINASAGVTFNGDITASGKNITAAKFIGNLDGTSTYADYASSDKSKGTIEERLTNLGFKQSSISLSSGFAAVQNSVTRQGNYVIGFAQVYGGQLANVKVNDIQWAHTDVVIGTLSNEFRPKTEQMFNCSVETDVLNIDNSIQIYTYSRIIISTDGTITLKMYYRSYAGSAQVLFQTRAHTSPPSSAVASNVIQLNFGYEARL